MYVKHNDIHLSISLLINFQQVVRNQEACHDEESIHRQRAVYDG